MKELREDWDKKVIVDEEGNIKYTPERFARIDDDDRFQEKREAFLDKIGEENIIDLQWDSGTVVKWQSCRHAVSALSPSLRL